MEIVENELPTSALVRVEATDADAGHNARLVYGLDAFSAAEYGHLFRVDPASGEVFVRRALDREAPRSVYSVTVTATDGGSPALSAFTRVLVRVVDANDHAPRVTVTSTTDDPWPRFHDPTHPTRSSFFYRAMLCIRGTSHGPVSVRPSVRLSVRHKSVFY